MLELGPPAFLNENHLLSIVSYKDKIAGLQQIWLFTGSKLLNIGTKLGPTGTWPPTGKPQLCSRASVPGPSDGAGCPMYRHQECRLEPPVSRHQPNPRPAPLLQPPARVSAHSVLYVW